MGRAAAFGAVSIAGLIVALTPSAGCSGELPWRSAADSGGGPNSDSVAPLSDKGTPTPDAPTCGNGSCDPGEHCQSCPGDCGGCAPKTTTLQPVADSYVDQGKPSSNYGTATELLLDQSPDQQILLRFSPGALPGPLQQAKLRLHITNDSHDGPKVHLTKDAWTELGVTWNNRPKPAGATLTDLGNVPTGWLEIDVTQALSGAAAGASVSFLLVPTGSNGMDLHSRESSNAPQLVITTAGGPPPPDAGVAPKDGAPLDSGAPPPTAYAFFAMGDTRSNPSIAQQNFQSMAQLDPKAIAIFNSGDLTADGKPTQWQDHVNAVNLGSAGAIKLDKTTWGPYIRYFGVVGNHDTHESGWLSEWNKHLPGQQGLGNNTTAGIYFSVTYANAIFIVLDSENTQKGAQTTWLDTTLKAAAADPKIQWKFVFYHHPVYPCNYKSPWSSGIPWVRLFETYKVDIVFNGHAHVYERTCAMVGGVCKVGGVRYVITGGGGAGTGDVSPYKKDTAGTDSYDCGKVLKMAKGNWHHYCRLGVKGKTLSYACYKYNTKAAPEDTLTITK